MGQIKPDGRGAGRPEAASRQTYAGGVPDDVGPAERRGAVGELDERLLVVRVRLLEDLHRPAGE
jgi:hypothetical protein